MKILTVKDFTIKKPISTARYYFQEAIAIISMFFLIGLIFLSFIIFTPIQ